MRKMVVAVPRELMKDLKIHAVQMDRTLRELVIEGIEYVLKKGGDIEEEISDPERPATVLIAP